MTPYRVILAAMVALAIGSAVAALYLRGQQQRLAQARQNAATTEAVADAAVTALGIVQGRMDAEMAIDAATALATREIRNAADPDVVHAAVRRTLCERVEYKNNPACVK